MSRSRFASLFVPLLAALLLGGCGDDEESAPASSTTSAATPDLEAYCQAVSQLEAAGNEIFGALEEDGNATSEDFRQAEAQLLRENEAAFDDLQQSAPEEIRADVGTIVAGLRVRAGLEEDGPSPSDIGAAEKRVTEYEKRNCA